MALKNRHDFPANGFIFFEPRTGWTSTPHIGFNDTVQEIIRHRKANPGRFDWNTDVGTVEQELEAYTEARLRSMPGGEQWLMPGAPAGPPMDFSSRRRSSVPRAAEGKPGIVQKTVAGIGAVVSWLGSGLQTVDQATANRRAEICSTCDRNQRLEGMEKSIGTVGHILHSIAEAKREMKLATPFDEKLHQCASCLCSLPTKIWAPTDHIKQGTTKEIFDSLAPQCWIRKELTGNEPLG